MYCKLTTQGRKTRGGFRWEADVWNRIEKWDRGNGLCSEGYFHCYDDPILAVVLNPAHASIRNPRLFRVNVRGSRATDDGLKYGFTMMKLAEEMELPEITATQHVRLGILCVKEICDDPKWTEWADGWLRGEECIFFDRKYNPGMVALTLDAVNAIYNAVYALTRFTTPTKAMMYAGDAVRYSAWVHDALDLKKLAKKAMEGE